MKTIIKTRTSNFPKQNHFFIWTAFSDGSAESAELVRNAPEDGGWKQIWSANHEPDSEEAKMIHAMED